MSPLYSDEEHQSELEEAYRELKVEHDRLKESYSKLARASAMAHHQAAVWSQFATKLSKQVGDDDLKKIGWPEDDYLKTFMDFVLNHVKPETPK